MDDPSAFEKWVSEVRRHTLTEAHGPEEAARLMAVWPLLDPGELATRDESLPLMLRRRDTEGARHRPRSDETRARDLGLSVEQWRRLAR